MFPLQHRTVAETDQFCEICGNPIGNGYWNPPWPARGPVIEADFWPHELKFHCKTSDEWPDER